MSFHTKKGTFLVAFRQKRYLCNIFPIVSLKNVFYHDEELARGSAKTKREAEKEAALKALEILGITEGN